MGGGIPEVGREDGGEGGGVIGGRRSINFGWSMPQGIHRGKVKS